MTSKQCVTRSSQEGQRAVEHLLLGFHWTNYKEKEKHSSD